MRRDGRTGPTRHSRGADDVRNGTPPLKRRPVPMGRIIVGMFKRFTVIILTVAALSALSACSGDADVRMGPASDVRVEAVW